MMDKTDERAIPSFEVSHAGVSIPLGSLIRLQHAARHFLPQSNKRACGIRAGAHQSSARGRGMDFVEVRPYQAGDDIRSVDWRVTARTGKLHTKLFQEERERPIYLIIDCGSHMQFGTRVAFKSVVAAQVAAIFAWIAHLRGDVLSSLLIHDAEVERPPAGKHMAGVLALLKALSCPFEDNGHSIAPAFRMHDCLAELTPSFPAGSSIILISDFSEDLDALDATVHALGAYQELIMVQIYDSIEQQLPLPNVYTVSDGSAFSAIDTSDKSFCLQHTEIFRLREAAIQKMCERMNGQYFRCQTDAPVVKTLFKQWNRVGGNT